MTTCKESYYVIFDSNRCEQPVFRNDYCMEHYNRRVDHLKHEIIRCDERKAELLAELETLA